jgi:hypothetical protein
MSGQRVLPGVEKEVDPLKGLTPAQKEAVSLYGSLDDPRAQRYVTEARTKPEAEIRIGSVPAGYREKVDPDTGERTLEALEGSPAWEKRQGKLSKFRTMADTLGRYRTLLETHGAETGLPGIGDPALAREMESMVEQLKLTAKELFDMGALQEHEQKQMDKMLGAATGIIPRIAEGLAGRELFTRPLEQLAETLRTKMRSLNMSEEEIDSLVPRAGGPVAAPVTRPGTPSPDMATERDALKRKYDLE